MRPENPESVTPDVGNGYRITVPTRLIASRLGVAKAATSVNLIPLLWKRALPLPDGHQLEAWFVWSEDDPSQDWLLDPRLLLDPDQPSENRHHLLTLIHPASLVSSDRKHRLSCAGLFRYLVDKGGPRLWITDEKSSLGIMTDFAYHTAYGRLRL